MSVRQWFDTVCGSFCAVGAVAANTLGQSWYISLILIGIGFLCVYDFGRADAAARKRRLR